MPLGKGVRYRWTISTGGKKVRLAIKGKSTVVEVKPKGGVAKMVKRSTYGSGPVDLQRGYTVLSIADPTQINEDPQNAR